MDSGQLRKKFLDFYRKKGHKIIPSSSILSSDKSVLFTTAGMQQFKKYFLGEKPYFGLRAATCQKCFRTSDIGEVGDDSHLTFLEMLGNFSFGDYFKKEAIKWSLEFLTEVCKLKKKNLWITIFKGDKKVSKDNESKKIWRELGIPDNRISEFGREDNFWGPTGLSGPCGPTTEIHYDLTGNACGKKENCIPNCSCGRFIEIWNLVFNEYYQDEEKNLKPLEQKGVDTGMGLERLLSILQGKSSIFETDLFIPIIREIESLSGKKYVGNDRIFKIIADHIRAAAFLIEGGVLPSNLGEGYVLRRILRRCIWYAQILSLPQNWHSALIKKVGDIYGNEYPEIKIGENNISAVIKEEENRFLKTLEKGKKVLLKIISEKDINGIKAFTLYESYGIPFELTKEIAEQNGFSLNKEEFNAAFKKHQAISRRGAQKKFGGHGAEQAKNESEKMKITKLHSATHLLQQALSDILGAGISQKGADINAERLRFDFSFGRKLSLEEIQKIENLVNQRIKAGFKVKMEIMPFAKALRFGALHLENKKYPDLVKVYTFLNPKNGSIISREICAGPHIENSLELGRLKIIKEESSSKGVRRIRAILE